MGVWDQFQLRLGAGISAAQLPAELLGSQMPSPSLAAHLPNQKGVLIFFSLIPAPAPPKALPEIAGEWLTCQDVSFRSVPQKKRICVLSLALPGIGIAPGLLWDGLSLLMRLPLSARLREKLGMAAISPGHGQHPGRAGTGGGERSQGKAGWRQLGVPAGEKRKKGEGVGGGGPVRPSPSLRGEPGSAGKAEMR